MANRDSRAERGRGPRAPRRHRTRLASGALALTVGLLLAACTPADSTSTPAHAPASSPKPRPTPTPSGPYAALGDSYTSGPGIPDQVGTPAGCDRSNRNYPALTTVVFPKQEMARQATELLLRSLTDRAAPANSLQLLRPRLIVRESTGPVGGATESTRPSAD